VEGSRARWSRCCLRSRWPGASRRAKKPRR
jgi:hypothetical protein